MSESTARKSTKKVAFGGPEWVDHAREVLNDLVAAHGKDGQDFSACEQFRNAPKEFASADGSAAWHFRIKGKSVQVSRGVAADVDAYITGDYASTLPGARQVYTPEFLAERAKNPPKPDPSSSIKGDMSKAPPWLVELHNRLALITA